VLTLLTLLWGRLFCSYLCPVGILQDIAIRLRVTVKRSKGKRDYTPNHRVLRYSFTALLIAAAVMGAAVPLGLMEPFSIFGRFTAAVVKPAFIWFNNLLSDRGFLEIYPLEYIPFSKTLLITGAATMLAIMLTAIIKGRLFCNTLCPVGALLGLLSKVSWYKIGLDLSSCTKCGKCAVSCKAGCIDYKNGTVDSERCISCFNCLPVCNTSAMKFSHEKSSAPVVTDFSRRSFFLVGGSTAVGAILVPALLSEADECNTVMPPGAVNFKRFTAKCTGCQLCVSNCPGNVLKPASLQYGLRGFIQPQLDFNAGMCEYDCTVCSDICPTGALLPVSIDEKHTLQLGVAEYIRSKCVVRTDHTHCGACAEHCPTGAVHMVEWKYGLTIPQVEPEMCIGCGACEYVCPVLPEKAIVVSGLKTHGLAEAGSSEQAVDHLEGLDFPF